ncbi:unnamed protein product [Schistosoma spindalis]|nr:unnamed protein product [Schistosoma spindale]
MRIRHPRFDSPIQSPSTTNEMRKHLLNSSQGSSIKMSDSQQCKSRQSSPRLSSTDGHVSSISGMSESCDDPTNTYLNPDFTDPQLMTKCDSSGPSPLAMLARTCQNIGNIMDCGNSSNRFLSSNSNSIRKQSTVSSIPVTNGRIINNSNGSNNSNITKLNKPKVINLNEVMSSSFTKRNTTSKYLSSNDTSRLNFTNTSGSVGTDLNNSVINTTGKTIHNNNDSMVSTLTTRQQSPISISSTLFSSNNSTKTESNLTSFNNNFIKSDDLYQTSNALAQLARLSSSFSLPETPKLNFTCFKNSNHLINNRNSWNDIKNNSEHTTTTTTNNNNNNSNIQHDPNSLKRIKRRTNSNSKYSNTFDECNSPPSAKRCTKDNNYSFIINSMNNYINNNNTNNNNNNNNDSNHSNYELNHTPSINISSNMATNIMNNRIQSPNYNNFILNNEQLFKYKETNNIITNKDTQEKFSYQLARSFLDYFYGKLVNSINSESNISSTTTITTNNNNNNSTTTNTTTTTPTNSINNNNNNHTLFKEDYNESVNPLCINNERRTLEWLTSTNLINRQHTIEQLNPIINHNVTTSINTFPCLLCGQIFHGHTELCMHVYTHLLAFNVNESKKSNYVENNMRLLHSETNQFQNNRSNSLLIGSKNDHSFMPFFFPPPPSQLTRSAMSMTTINTPTTVCSVNYNNNNNNNNNIQSHPINDTNHSFNHSDLFQSYLSQWIRSFSSPNSNNQLNDMINHNQSSNLPWISTDNIIMNKSIDYKTWQNILTAAYLYSLKESTTTTTTGTIGEQISTTMTNSNFLTSIPLQNSLHKNDNSNYYDILLGSKPFITPFPQS